MDSVLIFNSNLKVINATFEVSIWSGGTACSNKINAIFVDGRMFGGTDNVLINFV